MSCARAAVGTRVAKQSRSTDLSRRGERPSPETLATLPVAVDAVGGDKAPAEVVEGARRALEEHGVGVALVGPPELVGDTLGLPLLPCSEVIAMDEDPAGGVRRKKDSSLVRVAEMVRDGKASRHGLGRQHGSDHGFGSSADGAPARRRAALHCNPTSPARPCARRAGRRRGERRVHRPHAGPVRRDGRCVRLRPIRDTRRRAWACSPSARSPRRAHRWSRRPTVSC